VPPRASWEAPSPQPSSLQMYSEAFVAVMVTSLEGDPYQIPAEPLRPASALRPGRVALEASCSRSLALRAWLQKPDRSEAAAERECVCAVFERVSVSYRETGSRSRLRDCGCRARLLWLICIAGEPMLRHERERE
jgi:hypothetical protein